MPPRYAYWTILIDDKPTAFRARDQAELLPTLQQLKRTNPNALMKWFARGKLWDTPEQAQWAGKHLPKPSERRGRDWRPGGNHRDERARFQKRPDRAAKDARPSAPPKFESRPSSPRPPERHRRPDNRPRWGGKPTGGKPTGGKPSSGKTTGGKPIGMKFRKPWRKEERQTKGDEDTKPKPPRRG